MVSDLRWLACVAAFALVVSCGDGGTTSPGGGGPGGDEGTGVETDTGGQPDAGVEDAGVEDTGGGEDDAGIEDAGGPDEGPMDTEVPKDEGVEDTGSPDKDTGSPDKDTGSPDKDTGGGDECATNEDCTGDPNGGVCDTEYGDCVECLSQADCDGNPNGSQCGADKSCHHADSCIHFGECKGHPDGDLCVFFEERCGECRDTLDCGEGTFCSPKFVCVPYTDAFCKQASSNEPIAKGSECVECTENAHCADNKWRPRCGPESACVECLGNGDCSEDEPICASDNSCGECKVDSDCPSDEPQCTSHGYCTECDSDECPSSKPYCGDDDGCVECTWHKHCAPGANEFCNDGVCKFEANDCTKDKDCESNAKLTRCHPTTKKCVQCQSEWDCSWGLFGWGSDGCNLETGACVECLKDSECIWQVCDTAKQECVDCNEDSDCDDGEVCNNHGCTDGCKDDSSCAGTPETPYCNTYADCVECQSATDCEGDPDGPLCLWNGTCGTCTADYDCEGSPNGPYCNFGECSDTDLDTCKAWGKCTLDMTKYVCGTYVDGCDGTLDCGSCGTSGDCIDGGRDCGCPEDSADGEGANGTSGTATDVGDFKDGDDPAFGMEKMSIHTAEDVDWYTFGVEDTGFDGNPVVTVSLEQVAPGAEVEDYSEYELTLWVQCLDTEDDSSTCLLGDGAPETDVGVGCTVDGSYGLQTVSARIDCDWSIADDGIAYVRVRKLHRHGRCDGYTLSVNIK